MTRDKLGDSYDIVKRFIRDTLHSIAPLKADPYFLEPSLNAQTYQQATGIPVFSDSSPLPCGLLLDPHTGVHVSAQLFKGRAYATTRYIADQHLDPHVVYCVVFDQSYTRNGVPRESQLQVKLRELASHKIEGFYYVSHAPFLFTARDDVTMSRLRNAFQKSGIPAARFFQ